MSEELTPKKSKSIRIKGGAKKVIRFTKKPVVKIPIIILVVIAAAYGIFYLGQQSGAKNQKAEDAKTIASAKKNPTNPSSSLMNRKTFIGTVSSVNDKALEITPRTGDKVTIKITSDTKVTGSDAKKTDVKAIKKDQKVIVSTTKDKDGKYTATRIRIQK